MGRAEAGRASPLLAFPLDDAAAVRRGNPRQSGGRTVARIGRPETGAIQLLARAGAVQVADQTCVQLFARLRPVATRPSLPLTEALHLLAQQSVSCLRATSGRLEASAGRKEKDYGAGEGERTPREPSFREARRRLPCESYGEPARAGCSSATATHLTSPCHSAGLAAPSSAFRARPSSTPVSLAPSASPLPSDGSSTGWRWSRCACRACTSRRPPD